MLPGLKTAYTATAATPFVEYIGIKCSSTKNISGMRYSWTLRFVVLQFISPMLWRKNLSWWAWFNKEEHNDRRRGLEALQFRFLRLQVWASKMHLGRTCFWFGWAEEHFREWENHGGKCIPPQPPVFGYLANRNHLQAPFGFCRDECGALGWTASLLKYLLSFRVCVYVALYFRVQTVKSFSNPLILGRGKKMVNSSSC